MEQAPKTGRRVGAALIGVLLASSMLTSGYAVHLARHQTVMAAPAATLATPMVPPPMLEPGTTQAPGFAALVRQVKPAVVNISTTERVKAQANADLPQFPPGSPFNEMLRRFGQQPEADRTVHALGSGFIIDPAGWVITNNHVVDGATSVSVTLDDGRVLPATVRGRDERTDVAVLKIESKEPLPALRFGDSDQAQVGDWVLAIGNPFGLGGTVTAGIVSARSRNINAGPYDDFLQIDAPINRGNSGGPLFDLSGQVIGVNTAIFSPNGGSIGIGFAIPAKIVHQVAAELIANGRIERGYLGVSMQPITPQLAKAMQRPDANGALVAQITAGSPAERSGLQPGDVVTGLNGVAVKSPRDLARAVANLKLGSKAQVEVWRDGKTQTIGVTIGTVPNEKSASAEGEEGGGAVNPGKVGLALAQLTPEVRTELGIGKHVAGVVVTRVRPDSPAAESGLQPGDVIIKVGGRTPATPAEAVKAIQDGTQKDKVVALQVLRGSQNVFVALDIAQS